MSGQKKISYVDITLSELEFTEAETQLFKQSIQFVKHQKNVDPTFKPANAISKKIKEMSSNDN